MSRPASVLTWIALGVPPLAAASTAVASPITWGTALEVQSESDIAVAGRQVVYAVNGGDNVGNPLYTSAPQGTDKTVVIGGAAVTFRGLSVTYGSGSTFGASTYGDVLNQAGLPVTIAAVSERGTKNPLADWDYSSTPSANVPPVYVGNTGNAGLDSILASQVWSDARKANSAGSSMGLTLNGLVPGTAYQVQIVGPADSRTPDSGTVNKSANVDFVSDRLGHLGQNLAANADVDGDGIAHVTSLLGTFTADASTTQSFDIGLTAGRNPGFSALILTVAAPEPTSALTVAASTAALLGRRRRRGR